MDKDIKIIVTAFRRFLIREGLLEQFKADYKFCYKRRILEGLTDKHYQSDLDWITYYSIRVSYECQRSFKNIIDVSLCYNYCKYDNWGLINEQWRRIYESKIKKILQRAQ